jgi:hypothetical protein
LCSTEIALELRAPGQTSAAWLRELQEIRGRVLYEDGRRPYFRRPDGRFCDPDPSDAEAFHIVARSQGRLAGCARILPADLPTGWIPSVIGERRLAEILHDLGASREHACDASRWVVAPEFRGSLGRRIVGVALAVGRWLSVEVGFVLACTCRKQDLALIRMGARPVPGLPLFQSTISGDQLRLLYFDVSQPSEAMRGQMDEAASALRLWSRIPPALTGRAPSRNFFIGHDTFRPEFAELV